MTEDCKLSDLSLSLCVYSAKIDVKDLNYIDLGKRLNPSGYVLAINSNFIHKSQEGFEELIAKPKKVSPRLMKLRLTPGFKERKMVGDGTCFQSCLDFIILIDVIYFKMRYFPKSGDIQVFGVKESFHSGEIAVERFINFLKNSGLQEFDSVEIVSNKFSLLNYKFNVILPEQHIIDITKFCDNLAHKFPPPFPFVCVSNPLDSIRKVSIQFNIEGKNTRIHIWPSGKINIMASPSLDVTLVLYDYLNSIFISEFDNIIKDIPIPDPPVIIYQKRKRKKNNNNEIV